VATCAADLLELAGHHARQAEAVSVDEADAAIAAIGLAGRQLERVIPDRSELEAGSSLDIPAVTQLVMACRSASDQWAPARGRLPDLVGSACDLIERAGVGASADESWRVTVELAATIRRCVDVALTHHPYARVPALRWVRASAVGVEQEAVRRPPTPASRAALEILVPVLGGGRRPTPQTRLLNALAQLGEALRVDARCGPPPVSAALAIAAAAQDFSLSCTTALASNTAPRMRSPAMEAPASWRVVHAVLVRFEDGSRRRGAEATRTVEAAQWLQRAVARFSREDVELAVRLRVLTRGADHLPRLAHQLEAATMRWQRGQRVFARARDLVRREELVDEMLANAVIPAGDIDIERAATTIRVAGRLSSALARDLRVATRGVTGPRLEPQELDLHARWVAQTAARLDERALTAGSRTR
jgi:hypothetical protein